MAELLRPIFLKGVSQYDVARAFLDQLAAGYREMGRKPQVVDALGLDAPGLILAVRAALEADPQPAFLFSFGHFVETKFGGRTLAQIFAIPHVCSFLDHPITQAERMRSAPRASAILAVDQSHIDAVQEFYDDPPFAHAAFCPHGGLVAHIPAPEDQSAEEFAARRDIAILFPASYQKPSDPPWSAQPPQVRRIFDRAVEMALEEEFFPAHRAFMMCMQEAGFDPKGEISRSHREVISPINEIVRAERRLRFVKAVAKAGLPLHVRGSGWEKHLYRYKSFIHGGPAGVEEVMALMARSRIVAHTNVNFGQGSHERPLTAMAAGACVISDHSAFWETHFSPHQAIELYFWRNLSAGIDRLGVLAEQPERAFEIARRARPLAVRDHLWRNRIPLIDRAADSVRERLLVAA